MTNSFPNLVKDINLQINSTGDLKHNQSKKIYSYTCYHQNHGVQRKWQNIFNMVEEKKYQGRISFLTKISFRSYGEGKHCAGLPPRPHRRYSQIIKPPPLRATLELAEQEPYN